MRFAGRINGHRDNIGLQAEPGLRWCWPLSSYGGTVRLLVTISVFRSAVRETKLLSDAACSRDDVWRSFCVMRIAIERNLRESAGSLALGPADEAVKLDDQMLDSSASESGNAAVDQQKSPANKPDRLLKATEIQRELGVSRATAYRLMTDGSLPTYRFGGANGRRVMVRVSLRDLRDWLATHRRVSCEPFR